MKKKIMAIICAVLTVLCVSFVFVGCIDDKGEKLSVSNEKISIDYNAYLGYSVKVTGSITNTMGKALSYISIEYKIYDSSNAIIGTAYDNASNIGDGETWKFEAVSFGWFDDEPATVKLSEIKSV